MSHAATPQDFLAQSLRALHGAWDLLLGRADGMRRFALTEDGFWNSFAAAIAALPVFLAYIAAEHAASARAGLEDSVPALARWVGFALDWVDMPLAMLGLALLMGLGRAYVPFVVAYNWGSVIAYGLLCAPMILLGAGLISATMTAFATVVLLGIVMRYRWFIARVTLGVTAVTAFGIALMDLLLGLVLVGGLEALVL